MREGWRRVCLGVAAACSLLGGGVAQQLDVLTEHGPVRGLYDADTHIRSFLGVPYGALHPQDRFKSPRPPANWSEVLETQEYGRVCAQAESGRAVGDEDCLLLNVFAPGDAGDLPVLLHVHGGELQRGGASPADYGARRLVPRGLVLVTPNYRLGPLGFLCLRDERAPGNAGLKDLRLALQWVHRNIRAFGGDPDRVTVSGEGTGGGAAGLLALAPSTAHLVRQLIAESGSPLSPWIVDRTPVDRALALLGELADEYLEDPDEEDVIELILQLNASLIVEKAERRNDRFRVCIESAVNNTDAFLTVPPYHLLLARQTNRTVAMLGYASGAGMREAAAQTAETMDELERNYYSLLPSDLVFPSTTSRYNAAVNIKRHYFGEEPISIERREDYTRYYSDATYVGPALRAARLLARDGLVFLYEFGYDGALNFAKRALSVAGGGAARGDLAGYVFQRADEPESLDEEDARAALLMTDLWSSFIINGTPSSAETAQATWVPLGGGGGEGEGEGEGEEYVLNVTSLPASLQRGVHAERLGVWEHLYAHNYIDCPSSAPQPPPTLLALPPTLALLYIRNAASI